MNDFEDPTGQRPNGGRSVDRCPIDRRSVVKAGLAAAGAAGAAALAGCASDDGGDGSADASGETLTIRVAGFASTTSVPYYFGLEQGLFDEFLSEYNAEFEITNFANGAAAIEAAQAGELDILSSGDQMLTTAQIANDLPFKIIGVTYTNREFEYLATLESGIEEPADVKGKRLGVAIGTNMYLAALVFLAENGLSADDVEVINLVAADQVTAFQTGDIDWVALGGINRDTLKEYGAVSLGLNGDYKSNVCGYAVSDEFAAEHPDLVVDLLQALDTVSEYANDNMEEVIQSTLEYFDSDEASSRSFNEDCDFSIALDEDALESIQLTLDYSLVAGLIDREATVDEVVDTSYQVEAGILEA